MKNRYVLASGTQVRQEDFGLLFYTMSGPRLYFLPSGDDLSELFFQGIDTLEEWYGTNSDNNHVSQKRFQALTKALHRLKIKGVIDEC